MGTFLPSGVLIMIQGVFGLPGMGKSTFMTKCAVMSLKGKTFMGVKPKKLSLLILNVKVVTNSILIN